MVLFLSGRAGQAAIVKAVAENDTCVILGETGSGKTTRECLAAACSFCTY